MIDLMTDDAQKKYAEGFERSLADGDLDEATEQFAKELAENIAQGYRTGCRSMTILAAVSLVHAGKTVQEALDLLQVEPELAREIREKVARERSEEK